MTFLYFSVCMYILFVNREMLPQVVFDVLDSAFNFKTFGVGIISTLIIGMQKGIFSSEVGLGTGSISAVTADTDSSAKNGIVQIFEIHFENLLIATITTFVICMTDYQSLIINNPNGIEITLHAFAYHMGNLGVPFITLVITLFGLSTILTGYYYGESSLKFIKKTNKVDIILLKILTIIVVAIGSVASSGILWTMTDIMVGIIAIINTYAIFKLRRIVVDEYKDYKRKMKKNNFFKVISFKSKKR